MKTPELRMGNVPDLSDLDLKTLKLANVEEPRIREQKTLKVVFNGVSLTLDIDNVSLFENSWVGVKIIISVSTETKSNVATITIGVVTNKDGTHTASTKIENTRDGGIKELGLALWEASLQLMQKFADELVAPITHKVQRSTSQGLSNEKWIELFLPLLEKYGYKAIDSGSWVAESYQWERTYLPHQQ